MDEQQNNGLNFEELCSGYVLNSLSEQESDAFLKLLESADSDQLDFYEDMKAIAAEMALLYPELEPTDKIREQLIEMAWASVNSPGGANILYLNRFRYAVAASVVFMLVSLGLLFYTQNISKDLSRQGTLLSEQGNFMEQQSKLLDAQENTILALRNEVERKEELLTILEARDVDLILMDGLDVNPNGYGKVVWDKENGKALLQVANLPSVPTDKDYQLWFIIDNQPISAGVFAVEDPRNDNFFKIEEMQQGEATGAFAITLEPKGGVPLPTGDMYLLGSMIN